MRWEGLQVAGTGAWLPERVPCAQAVAEGLYGAAEYETNEIESVCVAEGVSPPQMAVRAAGEALERAEQNDLPPVSAVFHSHLGFQGAEMWSAAGHISHAVGAPGAPAYDLNQSCNGAMAGLELAAMTLERQGTGTALLTTADRFALPAFDRWRSDSAAVYGDAGTALVLTTGRGFARLVCTVSGADSTLEAESRGAGFREDPWGERPLDLDTRREDFLRGGPGLWEHYTRMGRTLSDVLGSTLTEAGIDLVDVTWFVPVTATYLNLKRMVKEILHVEESRTTWDFGRTVGHLGSGDQLAGLHHLAATGRLRSGDVVALVGGGSGYFCTCAVLEIL
ncbi:MAG: 3-oxoacyl-[acyl-carrier-protein] synthase [Actinomycetota bacterium]|nr:3-oxoacyl-[acyl-carrier-protein] synthase [Actinomycetota bacterium]MDQ1294681.1 3-oxoacyl-[acyl-carrier-protein] synthase [Actinomycetota bacterium]